MFYVTISQATLQYATYTLSDGTTWLLPMWQLTGSETSSTGSSDNSNYSNNVLAVPSQYVSLQRSPIAF